jgi:Putative restriction endonuclease
MLSNYFEMEDAAVEKHEYHDGILVSMAGASPAHVRITTNLARHAGNNASPQTCMSAYRSQAGSIDPLAAVKGSDLPAANSSKGDACTITSRYNAPRRDRKTHHSATTNYCCKAIRGSRVISRNWPRPTSMVFPLYAVMPCMRTTNAVSKGRPAPRACARLHECKTAHEFTP